MKKLLVGFKESKLFSKGRVMELVICMDIEDTYEINYRNRYIAVTHRFNNRNENSRFTEVSKVTRYDFELDDIYYVKEEIESD